MSPYIKRGLLDYYKNATTEDNTASYNSLMFNIAHYRDALRSVKNKLQHMFYEEEHFSDDDLMSAQEWEMELRSRIHFDIECAKLLRPFVKISSTSPR